MRVTKSWPVNLTKKELHLILPEMSKNAVNCTDATLRRKYRYLAAKIGIALAKLEKKNDREMVTAQTRAQHEEALKKRRSAAFEQPGWDHEDNELRRAEEE